VTLQIATKLNIIPIRRLHPEAKLPTFATKQSACFDISACLPMGGAIKAYTNKNELHTWTLNEPQVLLYPGERYLIPTGWAIACPEDYSLRLYSRSGLAWKQGLMLVNGVGIVDSDYRHEVCVLFINTSRCSTTIEHGMRICQGEFVSRLVSNQTFQLNEAHAADDEWFTTQRTGGFGSTGVK